MRFVPITALLTILLFAAGAYAAGRIQPTGCTYDMQIWNINQKTGLPGKKITHAYDQLAPEERDPLTGCTVCSEDQTLINLPPLPPFSICRQYAQRIRIHVKNLLKKGERIHSIAGYHVIKSRGPIDHQGNRTQFSNHSFGTAIDINPEQNGLYDNCIEFGPECRLLRGGEWRPGTPGTLEKNSDIVVRFKQEGFKWGGEIAGKQKDFMHFSLTGY